MPAGKFEVAVVKKDGTWYPVEVMAQGANSGDCYRTAEEYARWKVAGRGNPLPKDILGVLGTRCLKEYSDDNPYNVDWSTFTVTQTCHCGGCRASYRSHAKAVRVLGWVVLISKDECPECYSRECEKIENDPGTPP
jgi:hypothetical protein